MSDIVAGVGRQPSVRNVLPLGLSKLTEIQGDPLQVIGESAGISFRAGRPDREGDFNRFTLHIQSDVPRVDDALEAAKGQGGACTVSEEDGVHVFTCPPIDSEDSAAGLTAVDHICAKLSLPEVWRFRGDGFASDPLSIELLFRAMIQYKASDLHLTPGRKPIFRVDNKPHAADIMGPVSSAQILDLLHAIAPSGALKDFEERHQCSFSFQQAGLGYARTSAFMKMGAPHITFRYLPEKVSSFSELGIPAEMLEELAKLSDGLLLIAGMGGAGKTTTAAAVIEYINMNRSAHILTIEDPIEIVFSSKRAFVSQRNLGLDVNGFQEGVEGAMRQDPDVLYIGEMRDVDTIRAAINAASTGVLVVSTLNSSNASGVVNRIVSFFEPIERDLVRQQLQDNLRAVICQKLVPRAKGGRIPALEVLYNDIKPISTAILEGSTLGIRIGMQQNLSHSQLFEHYIYKLMTDGIISEETARGAAPEISMYEQIMMGTYSVPRIDR